MTCTCGFGAFTVGWVTCARTLRCLVPLLGKQLSACLGHMPQSQPCEEYTLTNDHGPRLFEHCQDGKQRHHSSSRFVLPCVAGMAQELDEG